MKLAFTVVTPETEDRKVLALRGDLEENFRLLSKLGYHGAELMVRDPNRLDTSQIKALAEEFNLEIPAVSTGQLRKEDGLQLCSLDEKLRTQTIQRIKEVIDFTSSIGSNQVNIGTVRGHVPDSPQRADSLRAAQEGLNALLNYAQEKGIGIALEPQNRFIINWLNSIDETLAWIKNFPQKNLSILFDLYHALFEEPSLYASLIKAFPHVSHVQFSDSNRLTPGYGQVNFVDVIRVLRALGYNRFISIEATTQPDGPRAAEQAARYMLPLLADR
jgi:5-keto-L-gluconate epimerase